LQTLIATMLLIGLVMLAMAVGVIFSNRSLRGSCGGTGTACECDDSKRRECAVAKGGRE
jgi:hypothetical protein